ncbi:MAG: hypothetical protein JO271_16645 [Verrucomicrobia bacterium]|nr:hypothetical protein [Verrucomicrobiota bacterium]
MKEPSEDWLDEELRRLPDLEAPPDLMPKVMDAVQSRSARRWMTAMSRRHLPFLRNSGLGLALAVMVLVPWLNPGQAVLGFFRQSPFFNLVIELLSAGETILANLRIFNLPIGWLIGVVIGISYLACIFAASAIQRLASTKRL